MLSLLLVVVNGIRWKTIRIVRFTCNEFDKRTIGDELKIKCKCLRCKDEIASSTECHQLIVDPAFRYINVNMKSLLSLEFNSKWMSLLRVGCFVSVCTYYSSLYLWTLANMGADVSMCACFICMWNSALYWCRHHAKVLGNITEKTIFEQQKWKRRRKKSVNNQYGNVYTIHLYKLRAP